VIIHEQKLLIFILGFRLQESELGGHPEAEEQPQKANPGRHEEGEQLGERKDDQVINTAFRRWGSLTWIINTQPINSIV
jgi:hypothetical protein